MGVGDSRTASFFLLRREVDRNSNVFPGSPAFLLVPARTTPNHPTLVAGIRSKVLKSKVLPFMQWQEHRNSQQSNAITNRKSQFGTNSKTSSSLTRAVAFAMFGQTISTNSRSVRPWARSARQAVFSFSSADETCVWRCERVHYQRRVLPGAFEVVLVPSRPWIRSSTFGNRSRAREVPNWSRDLFGETL